MVYVSSSVQTMYFSCESLLNLGLLPHDFPSHSEESNSDEQRRPGDTDVADSSPHHLLVNATRSLNDGCTTPNPDDATCSCPQRAVTPPRPPALPFPYIPDNIAKVKAWLLQRYASSTFNTCPHRALPCMEGPPVEMHVDHYIGSSAYTRISFRTKHLGS